MNSQTSNKSNEIFIYDDRVSDQTTDQNLYLTFTPCSYPGPHSWCQYNKFITRNTKSSL
jgi:hypothetical protein